MTICRRNRFRRRCEGAQCPDQVRQPPIQTTPIRPDAEPGARIPFSKEQMSPLTPPLTKLSKISFSIVHLTKQPRLHIIFTLQIALPSPSNITSLFKRPTTYHLFHGIWAQLRAGGKAKRYDTTFYSPFLFDCFWFEWITECGFIDLQASENITY